MLELLFFLSLLSPSSALSSIAAALATAIALLLA
jgi:hypothetical protein